MYKNPLTAIDFYKADHRRQYPEGTELVYSNFTPRHSKIAQQLGIPDDGIVFFGLQAFIKDYLISSWDKGFFNRSKETVINQYKRRMDNALGKDAIGVEHIEALWDLRYLPIEIKALPEGTLAPIGQPVLTIKNTLPEFFWLTNYFESVLSCMLWKPCTSATIARAYKKLLLDFAEQTGGNKDFVQFQAHDFSFRGMSGIEDAASSGAGHLLSFVGTDTVSAIDYLEHFYNADSDKELIGCSVPATEHSVMCMGEKDNEIETFRRLIENIYPAGIVSIVSDTWDFWKVLTEYLPQLKNIITHRQGKVVIRPDSGDPVKIICGTAYKLNDEIEADRAHIDKMNDAGFIYYEHRGKYYEIIDTLKQNEITPTPEMKGAIQLLWETFGGTVNEKGFKELDQHIGLIYGDSITYKRAQQILQGLRAKGFASTNVVFGVGSFTYQYNTRDTFGFAVKATYGVVNGVGREIFKDPATDDGVKKSAKGLLRIQDGVLHQSQTPQQEEEGDLKTVFKNGELIIDQTLTQIRKTINKGEQNART